MKFTLIGKYILWGLNLGLLIPVINCSPIHFGNHKKQLDELQIKINSMQSVVDQHTKQLKNRLDSHDDLIRLMQGMNRRLLFLEERPASRSVSRSSNKRDPIARQISYQNV